MTTGHIGVIAAVGALALVAGCGDGDASRADDRSHVIEIGDRGYSPDRLTIDVGDRVTFVNRAPERPHSAKDESRGDIDPSPEPGPTDHSGKDINYATKRGFATHALFPEEPQTIVFKVPRTYEYVCSFFDMKGTIEVVPSRD